jgi:hypothetical protein
VAISPCRPPITVGCTLPALALLALLGAPLTAEAQVLEACVNPGNGNMRLVGPAQTCHNNETRVQWNVQGQQGPSGPQGPQGATGPTGPAGSAAVGPPYVWICTPANYPMSGSNPRADVYAFNAAAATANIAVHILDQNGVNLAGQTIPGSSPPAAYPGDTGASTIAVAPAHTRQVTFQLPQTAPEGGPNVSFAIRVVSDQPGAVGTNFQFSGFIPVPCPLVHP